MRTDQPSTSAPQPLDAQQAAEAADRELATIGWNRRAILRSAAVLAGSGAGTALATTPVAAAPGKGPVGKNDPQLSWLVGDHHVHTQYSHDAKYRIAQQLDHARKYGVDWLAFTEHANFGHAKTTAAWSPPTGRSASNDRCIRIC
ncbi:PHP domain-containing protein [Arthrobacter sp. NamB2]|uniref:PHP domain-containing protein n=1 Tax=Arthrobacter sp. NamB2 TaxID=2576035 RepID=UPI001CB99456|nr:PHP domain-containing protein [Arthrobacter sp. NamB2]